MTLGQSAVEGPVVLPSGSGEEVGDAHIYPDHRRIRRGLDGDLLLVGEREPPAVHFPHQRHAAVYLLAPQTALVIAGQRDRDEDRLT
jgi:hypothetical protein